MHDTSKPVDSQVGLLRVGNKNFAVNHSKQYVEPNKTTKLVIEIKEVELLGNSLSAFNDAQATTNLTSKKKHKKGTSVPQILIPPLIV
jgi:hypothetical protein